MGKEQESHNTHVQLRGMHKDVHEIIPLEGSSQDSYGRKALLLQLERLRVEVCQIRRAHKTLSQAHWRPSVPMQALREGLLQVRPPLPAHEEAHQRLAQGDNIREFVCVCYNAMPRLACINIDRLPSSSSSRRRRTLLTQQRRGGKSQLPLPSTTTMPQPQPQPSRHGPRSKASKSTMSQVDPLIHLRTVPGCISPRVHRPRSLSPTRWSPPPPKDPPPPPDTASSRVCATHQG